MQSDERGTGVYAELGNPDGFCDGAWRTIHPYVFALANGTKLFYINDWVGHSHRLYQYGIGFAASVRQNA